MTKDEALRLALEDAKRNERHRNVAETRYWLEQYKLIATQAITAIKAALEAKDEPVKAWCETCEGGGKVYQEHQAGCWVGGEHACPDCDGNGYYTTPPQSKPLTETEILLAWKPHMRDGLIDFARAIEAAHGIKGEA